MKLLLGLTTATFFLYSSILLADTKLALNWKEEPEFGGFYEALPFYKKQNLNITIQVGGSGTPTTQMLMNSVVDYAIVSAEEIILSADRDPKRKLVAIFAVFETSPYMIMAHENFKGKSLATLFQDSTQTISLQKGLPYVDYLLKKFAPVKAQIVPYTGGISLFQSNLKISQQGFITSEAILADQQKLKNKTWLVADEGFNPYLAVLAVREDYLKNNRAAVKKMVEATREGWLLYLKNPQATNLLMSQKNPAMSLQTMNLSLEKMKSLMKFEPLLLGQMKAERWQTLQQQMFELKLIKKTSRTEELFQNF
ncbi:MAG: ABC transporter substrate-binding protein [Bdellovibrio sp.]|nr:ABC transporter substrate-binding protein [Bdellovibrio sp.]